MPGTGIPGFLRRSIEIAKAGVYNLRVHHDHVLMPLLRRWGIANLEPGRQASELQDKIMALRRGAGQGGEVRSPLRDSLASGGGSRQATGQGLEGLASPPSMRTAASASRVGARLTIATGMPAFLAATTNR